MGSVDGHSDALEVDIDFDHKDQYLLDLYETVFENGLLLSKIMSYLPLKDLSISGQVCHKWRSEANRVIANRSQSLYIYHLFRTQERSDEMLSSDQSRTDEELEYCMSWADRYNFESNMVKAIINGLQSIPVICLLVYGSFGEDVKLRHRMKQTEVVRRALPIPAQCTIVNLNSQCLIGFPTTSSVPIEKITHFGDLAAVSLLLIPRYRSGVQLTLFNGSDMREKIFHLSDIKAIVIFTTSSVFQDNRNLDLQRNSMSRFITQSYGGNIAFGGYNSAYFSFNKKDFLNYMDDERPSALMPAPNAPSNSGLTAHDLIGICFSGPEVKASSIILNTKRSNKTEHKLRQFKKNLGFEPLNDHLYETLFFMFTDEEKNEAFAKLNIFRSVFVGSQVFGISGYGQYGHDFWPGINNITNTTGPSASGFRTNNYRNNRVLNGRQQMNKPKKRIAMNMNMTTFVVIKLKKKFV